MIERKERRFGVSFEASAFGGGCRALEGLVGP